MIDIIERCGSCNSGNCQASSVPTNVCVAFKPCQATEEQFIMVQPNQASGNFYATLFNDSFCTEPLSTVDLRCNRCTVHSRVCHTMFLDC